MTLLLQRIIRCRIAFQNDFCCLDLKRLLGFRSRHQSTGHDQRGTDIRFADRLKIRKCIVIYHLDRLKECAVVQYDKSESLAVTDRSDPAADSHFFPEILLSVPKYLSYINNVHLLSSFAISAFA